MSDEKSGKGKAVVQAVITKEKKDGSKAWGIIIDEGNGAVEYWDSKGNFKDSQGKEIEFDWSLSQDGKIKFINPPGGGQRKSYGKSPEELALQKKSFSAAYAKDIVVAAINQGTIKSSVEIDATLDHYFNWFNSKM